MVFIHAKLHTMEEDTGVIQNGFLEIEGDKIDRKSVV